MSLLVLLRHGESVWNQLNLFTGWVDVPLSEKGIEEALKAGELLKYYKFDMVFTSELVRAIQTAMLVMSKNRGSGVPVIVHSSGRMKEWGVIYGRHGKNYIPVIKAWQLNERYYGKLQGFNKDKAREIYGKRQVLLWRRSYDVAPPEGESLEDTARRTIPYFEEKIITELKKGKNVLVSAHGNSLRSIVMHLENLSEEVLKLNIPTGVPLIYEYKEGDMIRNGYLTEEGINKALL